MQIITKCPRCGKIKILDVPEDALLAWQNGMLIQDALPMLNPDDREALITGICPDCWNKMFDKANK